MRVTTMSKVISFFVLGSWFFASAGAAQTGAALTKAKQDAEAKGYIFETSHDDIVNKAKKEGKLVVFASQDDTVVNAVVKAFRKKYPFIEVNAQEISGTDTYLRMIKEMQIGRPTDWDVNYVAFDYFTNYLPYQKKFDMLGMAQHGVIKMQPAMIDPDVRNIVALEANIQSVAYNKKLMPENKLPKTWEDFLKPEFKGKKFSVNVRPLALPALVPLWGLERVLTFARNLKAQDPIWVRGSTRTLTYMVTGDVPLHFGMNHKSLERHKRKKRDPQDVLASKIIEPIPVRLTEAEGISASAAHPYAALLWLEFQASQEGQKILDDADLAGSHLSPGTFHEEATRGKQLSVMDWKHYPKMTSYQKAIIEAYGFPVAQKFKK